MHRETVIQTIQNLAGLPNAFDHLEESLANMNYETLCQSLLTCGIIPEVFAPDSSEEKLWAKYCDILLSKALNTLGIQSYVLRTRGDSADVFGTTQDYTIVADAKAFRLSRTAKNQKDFKVTALNDWRRDNTFACLVSPLAQYPFSSSQIYLQAEKHNVTLLSYVHIRVLLEHAKQPSLKELWMTPKSLLPDKNARRYWEAIDQAIVSLTEIRLDELREYKQIALNDTKIVGEEGIAYWESVIVAYQELTQEEAVRKLIKAEKIEEKIKMIKAVLSKRITL
jgi:type II restriction enzyme